MKLASANPATTNQNAGVMNPCSAKAAAPWKCDPTSASTSLSGAITMASPNQPSNSIGATVK
jgi:hypothetical protein